MKNLFLLFLASSIAFTGCKPAASGTTDEPTQATGTSREPLQGSPAAGLTETHWRLVELNGQPVTNPGEHQKEAFIILYTEGNRYSGSGGCNNLIGTYELDAEHNRLRFIGSVSTLMACPDMTTEDEFKRVLESADNYAINGKHLMLHKARMAPLAKLEAVGE